jgi:hypothetical protein
MKRLLILIFLFSPLLLSAQGLGIVASSGSATPTYGAELVTNGDFALGTGWTLTNATISGGACVINGTAFTTFAAQNIAITVGKSYKVEFDINTYSSGTLYVLFGDWTNWEGPNTGYNSSQHVSITIVHSNSSAPADIWFYSASDATVCHIDNVSVKEIL